MIKYLVAIFVIFASFSLSAGEGSGNATLYYSSSCGHCTKVLSYMRRNNISISKKNISNPQYKQELRRLGHKGVPVLVVGGRTIVGSTNIISYFGSHSEF